MASYCHCNKPPLTVWLKTIHAYSPLGFPGGSVVKNLPASAGDLGDVGSIPGSGRSPRKGNGSPFQYSCLENPMDRGAWWATVHRVTKSWTRLSVHASRSPLVLKGTSLEQFCRLTSRQGHGQAPSRVLPCFSSPQNYTACPLWLLRLLAASKLAVQRGLSASHPLCL